MWAIFLCHSYTRSWSAVFSLCSLQATLSPMQALLFPGEHFRKLFWCLAKLVQLGAWLQGLLWQHEQPIRGKAVFSVGVWGVCLCVHMGVCIYDIYVKRQKNIHGYQKQKKSWKKESLIPKWKSAVLGNRHERNKGKAVNRLYQQSFHLTT